MIKYLQFETLLSDALGDAMANLRDAAVDTASGRSTILMSVSHKCNVVRINEREEKGCF